MQNYFNFRFKYSLIKKIGDVWDLKSGKVYEVKYKEKTRCFRAYGLFAWIYHLGATSLLAPFLILLFVVLNLDIFDSLLISFILSIVFYIVLEYLLIALTPIKEVSCIEKKIEDKKILELNK